MARWCYSSYGGGMLNAYNAHPKSIGDLLSDTLKGRVVVPEFQRGYSWGKKHVTAFWKDIHRFQKETTSKISDAYFLGPIVVMEADDQSGNLFILDGQQRLATATILFSVLRDLARALQTTEGASFADDVQRHYIINEDFGDCLEMGALDREYFKDLIQSESTKQNLPKRLRSHQNISKARELLSGFVKSTLSPDQTQALKELKALHTIVRRDLIMAAIPVKSKRDAFRIFETLNDRGLRLSVPDLLLNHLMGASKDDEERKRIRKAWDGMISSMGKKDIGDFLRCVWISKYGDLKQQDLFSALKDHLEANNIKSIDFAKACSEECEVYLHLVKADPADLGDAGILVDDLVNNLGFEVTLPLLLSAYTTLDKADFKKIVQWLLVFVVRHSIFLALDFSNLEDTVYALAKEIRTLPKKGLMAHIKQTLVRKAPGDAQLKAMRVDGDELIFMEPSDAVYILSRVAGHMQSKTRELSLGESNLEHVFPKNPSPEWTNTDELEPLLWHLGNLTMLGKKMNGSAANAGFPTKRDYYEKNSELKITQDLAANYKRWDSLTVYHRAKNMLPKILEVWDFDNPSRV
jgi:hypothetical protein